MKRLAVLYIILTLIASDLSAQSESIQLSLDEVIERACKESPDAESARHSFRSSYWTYRSFRADYFPTLTLSSAPFLNRSINQVTLPDGTMKFTKQNILSTDLGFTITQNVPITGGSFTISTSTQRLDMIGNEQNTSWQTIPINIGYSQALFGYNRLKWDRRIEPIRYIEAKKKYIEAMELVSVEAANRFFVLAMAQSLLKSSIINFSQADTLFLYAKGRYKLGTITENDMLQLELNRLNEQTNKMNAQIEVDNAIQKLRSYLGIQQDINLQVELSDSLPDMVITLDKAITMAMENSSDIENIKRLKLESRSQVSQAKANAGLKADVYMRLGLTQTAEKFSSAYKNPMNQQYATIGISLPILDWGKGKGRIRMARSNKDLIFTQANQALNDFQLNVQKLVKQFNLQGQRARLASKVNKTAQRRADVARRLYLLGKSSILDLNSSISEKNKAIQNYVSALSNFWEQYYTIRSITHYDFYRDRNIEVDYKDLISL